MSERAVHFEKGGHIARITFDNQTRRNAMSLSMWQRLDALMTELADDDDVRVVIVTGAGDKAFVSGADISEFEDQRSSEERVSNYNRISSGADRSLTQFPKPTIARIKGVCVGGGLGLALGCDIRIASEDARFALPAGKLALGYNFEGSKKLIDVVGPANAAEIFYTARLFDAPDAHRMGLVNRVVSTEDLDDTVNNLAETIARNAPLTLATFKATMKEVRRSDGQTDRDLIAEMADRCFRSDDYKEGRTAFMEKRYPVFKGK